MAEQRSSNLPAMSEVVSDFLIMLVGLATPDRHDEARVLAVGIAESIDALIDEARRETAAAVTAAALELARADVRVEAARAAAAESWASVCTELATAPDAELGPRH